MEDILDLQHEDLDYEEDSDDGSSPPAKKVRIGCPAEGCNLEPGRISLQQHWSNVHGREILLLYCPLRRCYYRSRTTEKVQQHLAHRHGLTTAQLAAVNSLPAVAELKKNNGFPDPGDVLAPFPPEVLPAGAVGPTQKTEIVDEVEEAMREAVCHHPLAPTPLVAPLMPPKPTLGIQMQVHVKAATREVLCRNPVALTPVVPSLLTLPLVEPPHKRTVRVSQKPATVSKPPPSSPTEPPNSMTSLIGDEQPPVTTAASSTSFAPASAVVIPSPTDRKSSLAHPAGILSLSPAPLESLEDCKPPSAERVGPCSLLGQEVVTVSNSPAKPDTATTGDSAEVAWLPAEGQWEDLEAWINSLPEELVAPPSPKPSKPRPPVEEAGGLRPQRAVAPVCEEASTGRFLRARLRSLDASINCLQKVRRDLQESVTETHKRELQAKEKENGQLRRRVRYLEAQLKRSTTGHATLPTRVGELQQMSTTRAFVLFPNVDRTAVYSLDPEDIELLDLANRSEQLSCDHL